MAFFKSCFPKTEMKLKVVVPACMVAQSAREKNSQPYLLSNNILSKTKEQANIFQL